MKRIRFFGSKLFLRLTLVLLTFCAILWILPLLSGFFSLFLNWSVWGIVLQVLITGVALLLVFLWFFQKERFFRSSQQEGLNVYVSTDVYRALVERILEGADGVRLNRLFFRPSKLSGVNEMVVDLSAHDPFSLSAALKELKQQIMDSIAKNIGDTTGLAVVLKVRKFEVRE